VANVVRQAGRLCLEIRRLEIAFADDRGGHRKAVHGIDLSIAEAEVFGLVGESGPGKTVSSLAILKLLDPPAQMTTDSFMWCDRDLRSYSGAEMRKIRGQEIAMIFQNPQASLNPARRVGAQLQDVLRLHRRMTKRKAREESLRLLLEVQIREPERVRYLGWFLPEYIP
jgi:ABC-type microcin C transport system duplicated ATPase subunit YejF